MDLHKLRTFRAVIETGSFTAAGEKVLLSQGHVSGHIKDLEQTYGVRLFDRRGRTVQLTEAGRILDRYAQRLFGLAQEVEHALDEYKGLLSGELVAGASTTPGTYLMPQVLGLFHERYPQIELDLVIGNSRQIQERVLAGEVEVAVIGQAPVFDVLDARPFVDDEIVPIASPRHPLARRQAIAPGELSEHEFIMREDGSSTRQTTLRALEASGVRVKRMMELGSNSAVVRAVAANLGISFLSKFAVETEVALGQVAILNVAGLKITRSFRVIWHSDHWLSPAARKFMEVIEAWPGEG